MDAVQKDTTQFFLDSWLAEAVHRCSSFLHSANKPFSFDDDFHRRRMFEEHYALTATVMGVRFAKQLVHHTPKELKESLESFIIATQDAVDVRDMREHSDEYFLGRGRKKEEFFKGSGQGVQCDMSSSVQNENGYMLGNLIAMETVRDECQALLQYIRDNA
ncbi:hypothetical protein J4377_05500 [Halomonas sp. XH26]|uniref:hypothetical protein n=1 Tax=Halomonas sp. XH26 TaxID=2557993 RepID=UPI0020A0E8C5|nr:hypothetical protein [Halomonas sp. XH26]UTA80934.1 hypothetical protein J4377_05500 [Halomonas sp. XH26]